MPENEQAEMRDDRHGDANSLNTPERWSEHERLTIALTDSTFALTVRFDQILTLLV
jgi:hypothetical protein